MRELVSYGERDGVAVIQIDNPPVNALGPGVPEALEAALDQAWADAAISAVVVMGAGKTFAAGADIGVVQAAAWGEGPGVPRLRGLLRAIEDSPKPVVMAIHGAALGGGLEVAMAGQFRVTTAGAQLGQPEVNLGIIPGWEGTQRLPRLVGVEKAIEMCVSGRCITAQEALAAGLVDAVFEEELLDRAVTFAKGAGNGRKTRLGEAIANAELFAAARELARKTRRGQTAPLRAIEAIEAATRLSFEEGCDAEWALFNACLRSEQARASLHAFVGERSAAKLPELRRVTPRPVERVAIVGAGTMGGGIAMAFANAGIPVLLHDASEQALEAGVGRMRQNYEASVKRGRFTAQEVEERLALVRPGIHWDGWDVVDMVVEAVFENLDLKKQVFRQLDEATKGGCILATNTSMLDIEEIASVTARPESVVGLHFFSPANVMRLLEIVRGRDTAADVIAAGMAVAKRLKKVGVVVGNGPGFVGNRLFFPYLYEAHFLVEEGATPEQVDGALTDFGMAMGPLAVDDLAGIDVAWRIRQEMGHFREPGIRKPLVQEQLYARERYGQKTGKGWYVYGGDRRPAVDPEITVLIEQLAREAQIPRRAIEDREIVERTVYALVNEGARVLEEGFARRASDIDVIYLNGYGFPAWRGGPMCYADSIGLKNVLTTMERLEREMGARWRPAPLLRNLAKAGRTFRDWDRGRDRELKIEE